MMPDKINKIDYAKSLEFLCEQINHSSIQFFYSLDTYIAKSFVQDMLYLNNIDKANKVIDVMPFFPMADYKQWMKDPGLLTRVLLLESIHQRPFYVYFANNAGG